MLAGQTIFVTGATGFMGKVLVEKILRSCPDVETVFLLVRPKKGKSSQDRIQDIIDTPLFDTLRTAHPESLRKLVAIPGDCAELRLGLSPEDEARLVECVTVVFHAAATVRFDDPLDKAILLNTRGTREAVQLAKDMKHLKVLQYVSTTYCHTEEPILQEKSYQSYIPWKTMITLAENEGQTLRRLLHKVIGTQPNSYTFSKALAEDITVDSKNDIPVVICRPAVVVSTLQEPISGWIDNLNGPFALIVGVLKGVVRYAYAAENVALSHTPVDWAIRGMILTAWARMNNVDISSGPQNVPVVNLEFSMYDRVTFREEEHALSNPKNLTLMKAVRFPKVRFTLNYWHYWTGVMISHVLFGMFIDTILRLSGNKPRLMQVYRKTFHAFAALNFFVFKEFPVKTGNLTTIEKSLPGRFYATFTTDINAPNTLQYQRDKYFSDAIEGMEKYALKRNIEQETNKKRLKILWAFNVLQNVIIGFVCVWLVARAILKGPLRIVRNETPWEVEF